MMPRMTDHRPWFASYPADVRRTLEPYPHESLFAILDAAAGRYPVPLRAVDMKSREVSGRGKVAPGYFSADDWDTARQITNQLLDELRDSMYGRPRRVERTD